MLLLSHMQYHTSICRFFFFNDTATTEIYTLSLHDALPISSTRRSRRDKPSCRSKDFLNICSADTWLGWQKTQKRRANIDRKSTRLNSSHSQISYAVFCLKKKKEKSTLTYVAT